VQHYLLIGVADQLNGVGRAFTCAGAAALADGVINEG